MWIDDLVLRSCDQDFSLKIWKPTHLVVVVGNGNDPRKECFLENCLKDFVPVYKRCGGGGTVVLHEDCLILSLGLWVKDYFKNDFYFCQINKSVIETLSSYDLIFSELYQDGVSDICFSGKKVGGTSLFRSRNYLLYQASILLDTKTELMERYLRHPSKEPHYRRGKSHRDFVVSLQDISKSFNKDTIFSVFEKHFESFLKKRLKSDLIQASSEQTPHLFKKLENSSDSIFI